MAHVLEGSVRRSGDRVRITAQLIDTRTDTQQWSQSYDRTLEDIFAIQDEIAADVVAQLEVVLLGKAPEVRATDPEAYALFLQAREIRSRGTAEALDQAEALLQQVHEIDPDYASAWVEVAGIYIDRARLGLLPQGEAIRGGRESAERALEIDPELAAVHQTLGFVALLEGDLPAAARHYERALELAPGDLVVLNGSAMLLASLGRLQESLALQKVLVARDPVAVGRRFNLGIRYLDSGRFEEAISTWQDVLRLSPGMGSVHAGIGSALLLAGRPEEALEEIEQETSEVWRLQSLPMAYHALGRSAEADAALADFIEHYERDWAYNIAYIHAFRGDADQAFEWLDKAVEYEDPGLSEIPTNILFANIHDDPRWLPFLRSIGKAPEQLDAIPFRVTLPQ